MVIPKEIREAQGIKEGDLLEIVVDGDRLILSKDKLWERFRGSAKGIVTADEVELELDEDDKSWEKRLRRRS